LTSVNRRAIESLVAAGAYDAVKGNRAQQFATVEIALNFGHSLQKKEAINQSDLFGSGADDGTVKEPRLPDSDEWHAAEILAREKEALGFYVSGHPLDKYRLEIAAFATANTETVCELKDGEMTSVGGIIQALRISPICLSVLASICGPMRCCWSVVESTRASRRSRN
jgi:DNA polymerase-3 subunit alpha